METLVAPDMILVIEFLIATSLDIITAIYQPANMYIHENIVHIYVFYTGQEIAIATHYIKCS